MESGAGAAAASGYAPLHSADQSCVLVATATAPHSRRVVSMLSCSKLCAVWFVAGVLVGYSLKRRVNRWVSKLLRKFKDD